MLDWPVIVLLGAGLALAILIWRVAAATRVARDARAHGWPPLASAAWAVSALVYSPWYWWQARLARLSETEARAVLAAQAQAHRLAAVVNLRCPLCDAEIENAVSITAVGGLAIRAQAKCPRCDFRLDACRHCRHFLPAEDGWGGQKDFTTGRCGLYRGPQPVREAYPRLANRLEAMGYETLSAPEIIVDSYVPLDQCIGFDPDSRRLKLNQIRWLGRQRLALMRLHYRLRRPG